MFALLGILGNQKSARVSSEECGVKWRGTDPPPKDHSLPPGGASGRGGWKQL